MASSSKRPVIAVNESVLTPVMTLEGHKPHSWTSSNGTHHEYKSVDCISYFPDGKQMISGSMDKTIRRWDLRDGKEIKEAREVFEHDVGGVGVSRDGRWAVTAVDEVLKVCEVETGVVRIFGAGVGDGIECMDISADSTLLAGASPDGTARIWSLDTGQIVAGPFKIGDPYCPGIEVRLSQDSRKLAATFWDSRSKKRSLQVWDVQAQKLAVTREMCNNPVFPPPVIWTTKGKSIIAISSPDLESDDTIYEFDASTLKTVGDSFQGHTHHIWRLALSFDCLLLATASHDDTIKLWSFESRQLLASFDGLSPHSLTLSPDSCQLAYTTWDEPNIYVCDIPANVLASIGFAKETSGHLTKLLNSDATCHPIRRKPPISVIPPAPRPLAVTVQPSRPVFLGFLRKFLPSSHTNTVRPIHNNEPCNPLDFPATRPLPRPIVDLNDNFLPPTTQSSPPNITTVRSLLHSLSTWRPLQRGHRSPAIVEVPLAQGVERNVAAGGTRRRDDEWIPEENHVSSPPSPNPDSQQQTTAGQVNTSTGEHGSGRFCFCF